MKLSPEQRKLYEQMKKRCKDGLKKECEKYCQLVSEAGTTDELQQSRNRMDSLCRQIEAINEEMK